ncbi:nematode cuticle collagen domain protein [Teladorsagia circumcincta]|uniref:Nematode cuticle collagen domain protein n=1 Tax=Teladorsagia circumcincta TaxID=45464 RepID=A0A2G9UUT3_TELCI|nr:nematode cuticle collagen domain protein [Teladorsagia circumcincta]
MKATIFGDKIIIAVASLASMIAIGACLIGIPSLYNEIKDLHDMVLDSVATFRAETDSAWAELMGVQAGSMGEVSGNNRAHDRNKIGEPSVKNDAGDE